jgi:hypothetical protein
VHPVPHSVPKLQTARPRIAEPETETCRAGCAGSAVAAVAARRIRWRYNDEVCMVVVVYYSEYFRLYDF